MTIISVSLFGLIGVLLRYFINSLFFTSAEMSFPLPTFLINILGSFLIGFVFIWANRTGASDNIRLGLLTGFLGGFTTFSAFSLESVQLLEQEKYTIAGLYLFGSLLIGLLAAACGMTLAKITCN